MRPKNRNRQSCAVERAALPQIIQSTFIGQKSGEDFYYLVLFGEGNDMQAFRKKYHLSMAQIPFFKNPFHIEKEQFPFLQELL